MVFWGVTIFDGSKKNSYTLTRVSSTTVDRIISLAFEQGGLRGEGR